ncbi:TetR/AcrR family transcriptional regulator [Pengzhenrongella phosphoraccumulans]|uniref:TetR/AcrR family transcriptional regulator n=1 Tax=Pengzhenrongella phosphoraccumulans TaxID=3114394 RepID=UPI00388D750E
MTEPPAPSAPHPAPGNARERVRTELTSEIKVIALAQLADGGAPALSLRGIAREMGMASSALFRYFRNRDALLTALIIDGYTALAVAAESAEAAVHAGSVEDRWLAICHGVREWAVTHPAQYTLIFGSPIPGYAAPQDTIGPASRVPLLLGSLLGDLMASGGYDPADHPELPAAVERALEPVRTTVPPEIPADLLVRGLMAWTYLFGAVSFELFGHRHNVIGDYAAFFDHEIGRLAVLLGLTEPTGRRTRTGR